MSYEATIRKAELMAMSPDTAAAALKARSANDELRWDGSFDEAVEDALLSRGHPLINLALARYGRFFAPLKSLFDASAPSDAIRLSVLSNRFAERMPRREEFPVYLVGTEEQFAAWLASASHEEIAALFENPNLGDYFLQEILEGKKPYDAVPNEVLRSIVITLSRNDRMWKSYDNDFDDGSGQYRHEAVFHAAWNLAGRVQPTPQWAYALGSLFQRLQPALPVKSIEELVERWRSAEADAGDLDEFSYGVASNYFGVRKGLARHALWSSLPVLRPGVGSPVVASLLASEDPAFRAAAYSWAAMTPAQILAGYERDGRLVFNHAVENELLWRTEELRDALNEIAWKDSGMLSVGHFRHTCEEMEKKYPEWFAETTAEADAMELPATKGEVKALASLIEQQRDSLPDLWKLRESVGAVASQLHWVYLFSLVGFITTVWRSFR